MDAKMWFFRLETNRAIAVAVIARPLTFPAISEVTELLTNREEPAKQELAAIRRGKVTHTSVTHSHILLQFENEN